MFLCLSEIVAKSIEHTSLVLLFLGVARGYYSRLQYEFRFDTKTPIAHLAMKRQCDWLASGR